MRKLLERWRQEGMFNENNNLPEAPDITIMPDQSRKVKPSSIRGASWDPITKSGAYLHVVHGHPESRTAAEWMAAGREAVKKIIQERDPWIKSKLFADGCYYFNAARWLREKSGTEKDRLFYLLENMKYAENSRQEGGCS